MIAATLLKPSFYSGTKKRRIPHFVKRPTHLLMCKDGRDTGLRSRRLEISKHDDLSLKALSIARGARAVDRK